MAARNPPGLSIQTEQAVELAAGVATAGGGDNDYSHCDIMMIGRTGFGKSTVGNKLLGIDSETKKPRNGAVIIKQWDYEGDGKAYFEVGDGMESVTKGCKVLSNENSMIRIMDTMGFADSEITQKCGVIRGNLQSFRWILQAQRAYDLRFARILYFFPNRGPPERVDGTLQEEVKVMYSFFGQKLFDVMAIVVTNHKRDAYQKAGFSEDDITKTKKVFKSAFKKIVSKSQPNSMTSDVEDKCPPVIYLPFMEDDNEVLKKVLSAEVISDADLLIFSPEYPKYPALPSEAKESRFELGTSHNELKKAFQNKGKSFSFEDRCSRCALKLVHEILPSGEELPIGVIYDNGEEDVYDNSYCHPLFIPKYSVFKRFIGGIGHIVTLGIFNKFWPGFTNSEELCIKCDMPPGSDSCHAVNQWFEIKGEQRRVDHSRKIDIVKLLEESSGV